MDYKIRYMHVYFSLPFVASCSILLENVFIEHITTQVVMIFHKAPRISNIPVLFMIMQLEGVCNCVVTNITVCSAIPVQ